MRTNLTEVRYQGTLKSRLGERRRPWLLSGPWSCLSSAVKAHVLDYLSPRLTRATDRKDENRVTDAREEARTKAPVGRGLPLWADAAFRGLRHSAGNTAWQSCTPGFSPEPRLLLRDSTFCPIQGLARPDHAEHPRSDATGHVQGGMGQCLLFSTLTSPAATAVPGGASHASER